MSNETIRAPRLREGGTIGICSPSHIAAREGYAPTLDVIRGMGYRVREAEHLYAATDGYLAAPGERAADFMQLILDPEVDMLLFGGGEGANELLPLLDFEAIRRHPKLICSYSDATWLLDPIWAKTGLECYYGLSLRTFPEGGAYEWEHFRRHLVLGDAAEHLPSGPWQILMPGMAEGIVVGGYLRNFALLLGSPYFPWNPDEKHLLCVEDHEVFGGVDYVSAMLSHIEQSPFMATVTGVLFGHYSAQPHPHLLSRLRRLGERWSIPVAYCDDFGHGERQAILPIGRRAALDTAANTIHYL